MTKNQITTYLAIVTAVGCALTLERALSDDTANAIGLLLATALVIVLPLVFKERAPRAAAAAAPREDDDVR